MARDERYRRLINAQTWRALRNATLARHPLCEDCSARGEMTAATEVHHIKPVETGRDFDEMRRLAYSPENLACLCHACHTKRHSELRKGSAESNRRRHKAAAEAFARKIYAPRGGGYFFNDPRGAETSPRS